VLTSLVVVHACATVTPYVIATAILIKKCICGWAAVGGGGGVGGWEGGGG
jgi:hypothetical protein